MPASTTATPARSAEQGRAFREARLGAGLDIRKLATRAEVNHSTISRWERGERVISEPTYQHLSLALADYVAGVWSA